MTTTVHMTEADFLASQRCFYKTRHAPKVMLAMAALMALFVVEEVVRTGLTDGLGLHTFLNLLPLALLSLVWLWFGGNYLWGAPMGSRRYFRQTQLHTPLEFDWSSDGFSVRGENMFQRIPWPKVLRWSEDRDSIVIAMTQRSYMPVPKRFFDPADLDELRGFLAGARKV
jgi:hypothetical protein